MLLTPHTIVGTALAVTIPNPFIAVPVSFVFHFLGDLVPHWDFYTNTKRENRTKGWVAIGVMADLALGVGVGMFFTLLALWRLKNPDLALNIFLCGIASVLPDVLTGPDLYVENSPKISKVVHAFQSKLQNSAAFPWGFISQVVVVLACVLMILSSTKLL